MLDPLDQVFAALRVQDALHARIVAQGAWGVRFAPGVTARFGLVVDGACRLELGEPAAVVELKAGDCYVIVRGDDYVLRDSVATSPTSCRQVVDRLQNGRVTLGSGEGPASTIVTGWFTFDQEGAKPLLHLMPRVLVARLANQTTRALEAVLDLLAAETADPGLGSSTVVSRLVDVLLITAVRANNQGFLGGGIGLFGGLSDPRVGGVIRAAHADLAKPWTVDALAREAGMSRSAFAQHFRATVGEAPLEYLTRWRMFMAGHHLHNTAASLGQVAERAGYESEAAFSKAFKRVMGVSPGQFRRADPGCLRAAPAAAYPRAA